MSKELPYFRFTVAEWLNGDIAFEDYELKGIFIDVCAYYWFKGCKVDKSLLGKRFSNEVSLLEKLNKAGFRKIKSDGFVEIKFLDEQYVVLGATRKKLQASGRKGGLAK